MCACSTAFVSSPAATGTAQVARAALSNLLGGMGYFYGSSQVAVKKADGSKAVLQTPPAPLFTAVPSRSFFPRGFLWDEGFHQVWLQLLPWLSFVYDCICQVGHASCNVYACQPKDAILSARGVMDKAKECSSKHASAWLLLLLLWLLTVTIVLTASCHVCSCCYRSGMLA